MFKPILLLSIVASLSACETINQASQCDPEKNYIISNPELMKIYKQEKEEGLIKNYFYDVRPINPCNNSFCIAYNYNDFDFYERNFDDKYRKGIYLVKKIDDSNNPNCIKEGPFQKNKEINGCYLAKKVENIVSKYKILMDTSKGDNQTIIIFSNFKTNEVLYKTSYQTFSTGAIGGPGIGFCNKKNNNPDFKFNSFEFPFAPIINNK